MIMNVHSFNVLALCLWLLTGSLVLHAQEKPTAAGISQLELEDLELMIVPMTRAELEVEAKAWQAILQKKAKKVMEGELRAHHLARKVDKATDQKKETKREKIEAVQGELFQDLASLRLEQAAVISRLVLVLDELEKKGGDANERRLYAKALRGGDC